MQNSTEMMMSKMTSIDYDDTALPAEEGCIAAEMPMSALTRLKRA